MSDFWSFFGGGVLALVSTFLGSSLSKRNERTAKAEEQRNQLCDDLLLLHSRSEKLGKKARLGGQKGSKAVDNLLRDSSLLLDIWEKGELLLSQKTLSLVDEMWLVNQSYVKGDYPIADWGHRPHNALRTIAVERLRPLPWRLLRKASNVVRKRWRSLKSGDPFRNADETLFFGFDVDVLIPAEAFEEVVRMCARSRYSFYEFHTRFQGRKDGMVLLTANFFEAHHRKPESFSDSRQRRSEYKELTNFSHKLSRTVRSVTQRRVRKV